MTIKYELYWNLIKRNIMLRNSPLTVKSFTDILSLQTNVYSDFAFELLCSEALAFLKTG